MLGATLLLAGDDTYSITNSARFNGTSDYLSKTLTTSSTTSGSVWVKRSKLGAVSPIFDNKVYFTSGDALYAFGLTSTALYRDPSAWMHIFWSGTGVYVNGTLVTGSGSYTAASVTNPRLGYDGTNYFSGYFSDFAFWDGSSASLQGGATDSNGVWVARRPSAGYSFLAFGSSGALGTDTSGNGNNWTVNGSPVQTTDTPTNNYATLSPINKGAGSSNTLSNGNTTYSSSSAASNVWQSQHTCTIGVASGKWYWEVTPSNSTTLHIGICKTSRQMGGTPFGAADSYTYDNTGTKYNGTSFAAYGATFTTNDVIGIKLDLDTGTLEFLKNNVSQGTAYTGISGEYFSYLVCDASGVTATGTVNFGATAFAYTPPTGYLALCTANLPSVAVTTSGTFTGNASADGPFVWTNGNPTTLTINGNAVTFGTHADKTAGGFKLRTSSSSYNTSGSNTWTATAGKRFVYSATSINNAQGNP